MDLVLLHAFPFDARLWARQAASLAGTARVHALDFPGFGADPGPALRDVDAMARAVRARVQALGLRRFVLGGMSMGGYAALAWVRQFGTADLAGLVLADTRADPDTPEGRKGRDDSIRLVREQGLSALTERLLPRLLGAQAAPQIVETVRALANAQRPESVVAALEALRDRPDSTAALPGVDVPTLVIGGTEDQPSPPAVLRGLAERIPGARLQLVDGAGHLSSLEAPDVFDASLRDFLRGLAG